MFQLPEMTMATINSVTPRVEKHGDDDKPAVSIKLSIEGPNPLLDAIDPALAKTFAQWSIFGLVLAGAAIMISRIVFPQIDLGALVKSTLEDKSTAAGIVAASIVFFVGMVMLALVIWAKA